ncbi:MAG: BtrH N-terminal domain-containing protein [Thalassotalea sp.]|nr:BtrH N-terminal domain-containing protein [Thalassotalea sp.]
MIIENFNGFNGLHCETTATGSLLKQIGVELSEPMLFGLGEGLRFIFWNMKTMDFPFLGGRVKPDQLTENICKNLNLSLIVTETASKKKAWENAIQQLQQGIAVGLKLDCYHLEYFSNKIHFAGHYVAMYGADEVNAYLQDTIQQGGKVTTSLNSLELARSEKGPMSSKNRAYTIHLGSGNYDIQKAIKNSIRNNATEYLNPPIKNIGYKGILKTSVEIKKWFKSSKNIKDEFQTSAMLMERAGTGGSLFRNLYRDFLKESYELLGIEAINSAHNDFIEIAELWKNVSDMFHKTGVTQDIKYVNLASELLVELSAKEKIAMEKLLRIDS